MRKIIIGTISIVVTVFLICWILFSRHFSFSSFSHNDVTFVQQLCDSAKGIEQSNPEYAILLYSKAIKKLEPVSSDDKVRHLLASVYIDLSSVYIPQGKYGKVKDLCNKALKVSTTADLDIKAQVLRQDGLIYYHQSQFEEALKLYEQAQQIEKKISNPGLKIKLLSNVECQYEER